MRHIWNVGKGFGKKRLEEAINLANDGDTILIEKGEYIAENDGIVISKNISFKGKENVNLYKFRFVVNGADVEFSDLNFSQNGDTNYIQVNNGANVTLKNTVIHSTSNKYPAIYLDSSKITIQSSEIYQTPGESQALFVSKGEGLVQSSIIENVYAYENSNIIFHECRINEYIQAVYNSIIKSPSYIDIPNSLDKRYSFYIDNNSQILLNVVGAEDTNYISARVTDSYLKIEQFETQEISGMVDYNEQSTVEIPEGLNIRFTNLDEEKYEQIREGSNQTLDSDEIEEYQKELEDEIEESVNQEVEQVSTESISQEQEHSSLEKLNSMFGIQKVKEQVNKFIATRKFYKMREKDGLKVKKTTLHSLFLGNPGTGKTTVARLLGNILFEEGVIETNKLVEVSRGDLVGEYIGSTAKRTMEKLEEARGGVLFIDEAYTLYKEGTNNDFGKEAIETILKFMEDFRDDIMIIFAGYTNEMQIFLSANPGLESRTPNVFDFEDYSPSEVAEIGYMDLKSNDFEVDKEFYCQLVSEEYSKSVDSSNARWVRNFNEKLSQIMAERVISTASNDFKTITREDLLNSVGAKGEDVDAMIKSVKSELDNLVGLEPVKNFVKELENTIIFNRELKNRGQSTIIPNYHMLFTGNPGTGKTTVARLIAKLFFALGILPSSNVLETKRNDFVGSYIGHTEANTTKILKQSMGGVLFIDEAYQLNPKGASSNDFGKMAIETLLSELEDKRDKFVAIFAGYTKEMEDFLETNPGLRSRIPLSIEFPDYSSKDIAEIVWRTLKSQYKLNENLLRKHVEEIYETLPQNQKSNGRWARNFKERLLKNHMTLISTTSDFDNIANISDETILKTR